MSIKMNNITLSIDADISELKKKAFKKLNITESEVKTFKILRESIDARRKDSIKLNYSVEIECEGEARLVTKASSKDIILEKIENEAEFEFGSKKMKCRPVIIGMGPAGMFAGLLMAQNGYKPVIFERGQAVDERSKTVAAFWKNGKLDLNSNVQFGEGGAGTFSDGKLTTRIKDKRCSLVLNEFVANGAPEDIIYNGKPHIGTDVLKTVVKNIRNKIIELGGEIKFSSTLEDIIIKDSKISSIKVNGDEINCENLILAIGHSSRDTYTMLYNRGVLMESKAFAIGARVEHLRTVIDEAQYGKYAEHPKLMSADYRLTHTSKKLARSVYSFCMCPGGVISAASSEEEMLVTNGMSYHARNGKNSNSAIVVSVSPDDFLGNSPLAGMEFQRYYERLAFKAGGGSYKAPVQKVADFLNDKVSTKLGKVIPTYKPGYEFSDMRKCLPDYVCDALKEGFMSFENKIKGFTSEDAVLTGIETRTSAPLRMIRNEMLQSLSAEGLYPTGEGAGFAGGIISAAVDGIKSAERLMAIYKPSN